MAKANPAQQQPAPPPQVREGGPEIVYRGEGADKVVFTINPKAAKYVVNGNGQVLEYMA